MDKFHDSAGVPWEGRQFSANSFADDDGSTPEIVAKALAKENFSLEKLHEALLNSRVLIPLLAQLGESELGTHGKVVDKSAELSIVAVATPDGQSAIPAFTSVGHMRIWKGDARPVPIETSRVALAAIAEGHTRVVLNPGTDSIALRRPFLAALAQQVPWMPPHKNSRVLALVEIARSKLEQIENFGLVDADPAGTLRQAELMIQLTVKAGLNSSQLSDLLQQFSQSLQSEEFLQLVDSVSLKVIPS